jgi:hypothetical protein
MGLVYVTAASRVGKSAVSLDAETLRRRLTERLGGFGSSEEELERVLGCVRGG